MLIQCERNTQKMKLNCACQKFHFTFHIRTSEFEPYSDFDITTNSCENKVIKRNASNTQSLS